MSATAPASPDQEPLGAGPLDLSIEAMEATARRVRGRIIRMSHGAGAHHLGSCLSCVDVLIAIYWRALRIHPAAPEAEDRDRLILSKGHAAAALYAVLSARGFFEDAVLDTYNGDGSKLMEHPTPGLPGVEAATGSLGHGLPISLGLALGARIRGRDTRVFTVMSDGECNEGSNWEAAMMAPAQKLSNLTAVIDFNKWQATGRSREVLALDPLVDKWRAFGWAAEEIDGHDMTALADRLAAPASDDRPRVFIAHTIKGRGVSFMEDDNNWHYRLPKAEDVEAAERELGLR